MKSSSFCATLLFLCLFLHIKLLAQTDNITSEGFTVKQYTVKEGLSSNGILDTYQDNKGFLWIGTYAGFMRFDGWQMEHIGEETIKGFRNSFYTSDFAQANDGRLFIATHGALVIKDGDNWQAIGTAEGLPSNVIEGIYFSERLQRLWIGTSLGLCYLEDNQVKQDGLAESLKNIPINKIIESQKGVTWVTSKNGLYRIENGVTKRVNDYNANIVKECYAVFEDQNGRIWVSSNESGMSVLGTEGYSIEIDGLEKYQNEEIQNIYQHPDGTIWVLARKGIYRYKNKEWLAPLPFEGGEPNSMIVDNEDNIWVGTRRRGLFCLSNSLFSNLTLSYLSTDVIHSLSQQKDGRVLISTPNGISICSQPMSDTIQAQPFISNKELPSVYVKDAIEDSNDNVWLCTKIGLLKKSVTGESRVFTHEKDGLPSSYVRNILEDHDGTIWVGTNSGLAFIDSLDNVHAIDESKGGMASMMILHLFESSDNTIWICMQNELWSYKDGQFRKFGEEEGLQSNICFKPYEDADGAIWFPHNGDISRYKDGVFKHIGTGKDKIPFSTGLFQIIEDGKGNFWLPSNIGVMVLNRQECNAYLDGKVNTIHSRMFDTSHGMLSQQCTGNARSILTNNGQLWFSTIKGVAIFDASAVKKNETVPEISLKSAKIDEENQFNIENTRQLELTSEQRSVRINFAAPSFLAPKQIWFKHKLEGFDKNWTESQERFIAFTNFPTGKYTLRIKVCNSDGVWDEQGASLAIYKSPTFYEHPAFWWAFALMISAILYSIFRWRVANINKQKERLELLVQERTQEISTQKAILEQSYETVQLLSEIGKEITTHISIEEIIDTVYIEVNRLMPADGFGIGIYNAEKNRIEFPGFIEKGKKLPFLFDDLDDNDSLSDYCFKHQAEVVIQDFEQELPKYVSKYIQWEPKAGESPHSVMYLPLLVQKKPIGNITVQAFHKNAYTENHLSLFRNLAVYTAIALDNASAYQKLDEEKGKVEAERQKSDKLLLNILPKATAAELKEKGYATTQHYPKASVLFTDFKGFTSISENMKPEKIVENLDYCFKSFDRIMKKYGIEKIKTIGDAYMAAAGISSTSSNSALQAVQAASEIKSFMKDWKAQKELAGEQVWEVRIGIHTGPVVAGVVGEDKFAYDIWGDTVNLASRMESNGEPNKVNISEATYEELMQNSNASTIYQFAYRGKVQTKGKGEVGMWFVDSILP